MEYVMLAFPHTENSIIAPEKTHESVIIYYDSLIN